MRRVRVFISSPGDVAPERELAAQLLDQYGLEYGHWLRIETIDWRKLPQLATCTFQDNIPDTDGMDIVLCILWSRLGKPLPEEYHREDGSRYASGTAYEFECALRMWELSGSPKLLVYRKLAPPSLEQGELLDHGRMVERAADLQAVEDFFQQHFRGADDSFTRAVNEFRTRDEFRSLLAPQLRLLLEEFKPPPGQEVYEGPERGSWLQGSPFRGLEEFRKEHAAVFFGRNKAVSEIYRSVLDNSAVGSRSVSVLGTSGSGKSSVLQAGVAPALMRPGTLAGIAGWRYLCVKPSALGDDPFRGLARLLSAPEVLPELLEELGTLDTLADSLRESASGGARILRGALSRAEARMTPPPDWDGEARLGLFLILDQFEEFFSLQAVEPATGEAFLALLKALATQTRGTVWLAAAMRSDYYAACDAFPDLVALMAGHGQYLLVPPTASEISQIVLWPARAAGLTFDKRPHDQRSLDEVLCEEAIANPECLPLLEFVLHELYELAQDTRVLSFKDYDSLGKMSGAIQRTAKQLFERLGGDAREALEQVLLPLSRISQDEGQVARRHVPYAHWANRPACLALVEAFVEQRLFVKHGGPDGEVHVTVAHEAVLREWDLAKQIIGDNRRVLQMRERVCQQRDLWSQQQEAESYLLQPGLALAEGLELAGQFRDGVSREDLRYIAISEKVAHGAERRRQRWIITRTALLFLVFVGVVVTVLVSQKRIADEQAESADAEARRQHNALLQLGVLTFELPKRFERMQSARAVLVQFLHDMKHKIDTGFAETGTSGASLQARARYLIAIGEAEYTLEQYDAARAKAWQALETLQPATVDPALYTLLMELAAAARLYAVSSAPTDDVLAEAYLDEAASHVTLFRHALPPADTALRAWADVEDAMNASERGRILFDRAVALHAESSDTAHRDRAEAALEGAAEHLNDAWSAISVANPEDNELQRRSQELRILTAERLGNVYLHWGSCNEPTPNRDPQASLKLAGDYYAREYTLITQKQDLGYVQSVQWLYDLGVCQEKLGEVAFLRGDYEQARARLEASAAYLEQLVLREPGSPEYLNSLCVAYHYLRSALLESNHGGQFSDQVIAAIRRAMTGEIEARRRWLALLVQRTERAVDRQRYSRLLWHGAEVLGQIGDPAEARIPLYIGCLQELRRAYWIAETAEGPQGTGEAEAWEQELAETEAQIRTLGGTVPDANPAQGGITAVFHSGFGQTSAFPLL